MTRPLYLVGDSCLLVDLEPEKFPASSRESTQDLSFFWCIGESPFTRWRPPKKHRSRENIRSETPRIFRYRKSIHVKAVKNSIFHRFSFKGGGVRRISEGRGRTILEFLVTRHPYPKRERTIFPPIRAGKAF